MQQNISYNGKTIKHPDNKSGKTGVLLINLGTPEGTDYKSLRSYLKEFLMDKRVIEWSPWKWYPILFGIVLNTRPQKVGKAYRSIWNNDLNESYLRTHTRNQAKIIAQKLSDHENILVDWAMRYGNPSVADRIEALQKAGCERIVFFHFIRNMRLQPPLPSMMPYTANY